MIPPTGSQFGNSTFETKFATRFDGREIEHAAKTSSGEYLVVSRRVPGRFVVHRSRFIVRKELSGAT